MKVTGEREDFPFFICHFSFFIVNVVRRFMLQSQLLWLQPQLLRVARSVQGQMENEK